MKGKSHGIERKKRQQICGITVRVSNVIFSLLLYNITYSHGLVFWSDFKTQYRDDNVKMAEQISLFSLSCRVRLLMKRLTWFCETGERKQRNERETVVLLNRVCPRNVHKSMCMSNLDQKTSWTCQREREKIKQNWTGNKSEGHLRTVRVICPFYENRCEDQTKGSGSHFCPERSKDWDEKRKCHSSLSLRSELLEVNTS